MSDYQPDVHIEFAFGADPNVTPTGGWTDVIGDLEAGSISLKNGNEDEQEQAQAESWSFQLTNTDGRYTPDNPHSPHYPHLKLGLPCRIRVGSDLRGIGNVVEISPEWPAGDIETDTSDGWSVVTVTVSGFLRRLGQGEEALQSALFRSWSRRSDIIAYWPGEDGSEAVSVSSPIRGVPSMRPKGVEFAAVDGPPGSGQLMRIPEGAFGMYGRVPAHPSTAGYVAQRLWRMDEAPSGGRVMLEIETSSPTLARWQLSTSATLFRLRVWDNDGTEIINTTQAVNAALFGQWVLPRLLITQSGTSVAWNAQVITADVDLLSLQSLSSSQASSTLGRVTQVGGRGVSAQDRYAGHYALFRRTSFPGLAAVHGYTGERAAARLERLCDEEGLACTIIEPPSWLALPGTSGSSASAPDAAALDIIGDLDVRIKVALDDWSSGASQRLLSKFDLAGNQRSWNFTMAATGALQLQHSSDGATTLFRTSSVVPALVDGRTYWLRAALDVDNGAGGHTVTFYQSDDGASWTQIGAPVVSGGVESIKSGTAPVRVGADGAGTNLPVGKFYEAEIRNGINGTVVASPNFSAQSPGTTAFADGQSNTWTVNGDAAIIGNAGNSMPMGPQRPDVLTALLQECADTDGGIFALRRDAFGFMYRSRASLYNQDPALELDAGTFPGDITHPFTPTKDDQRIRNDVTVQQNGGTSARVTDEQDIADRDRFAGEDTVNVARDGLLELIAGWRLHLGTYPGMRYSSVSPALMQNPDLIPRWAATGLGDRIVVTGLPSQHPPGDVDLLMRGYTDILEPTSWTAEANTTPAAPYRVWELEHETYGRVWSPRPYLAADVSDSATSFDVIVPVQRVLNHNPDFENSLDGWENDRLQGGNLQRVTDVHFGVGGRASAKFTPDGTTTSIGPKAEAEFSGRASRPLSYRSSVWVYSAVGGFDVRLATRIGLAQSLSSALFPASPVTLTAGVWTRLVQNYAGSTLGSSGFDRISVGVVYADALAGDPSHIFYIGNAEVGRPGAPFATSGIFPMPITMGGEVMTVTAIGVDDGTGKQTFTVTRAVNGVAKAHARGSLVQMHPSHVIAL